MAGKKISLSEKEIQLIEKIKKNKEALANLKRKRKIEIGDLAIKHGLDNWDNEKLELAFKQIAQEVNS